MLKGKFSQLAMATVLAGALLGASVVAAVAQGDLIDKVTGRYYRGKITEGANAGTDVMLFVTKAKADQVKIGSNKPILRDVVVVVKPDGAKLVQADAQLPPPAAGAGRGATAPAAADVKFTIDSSANPASMTYSTGGSTFVGTQVPQ